MNGTSLDHTFYNWDIVLFLIKDSFKTSYMYRKLSVNIETYNSCAHWFMYHTQSPFEHWIILYLFTLWNFYLYLNHYKRTFHLYCCFYERVKFKSSIIDVLGLFHFLPYQKNGITLIIERLSEKQMPISNYFGNRVKFN